MTDNSDTIANPQAHKDVALAVAAASPTALAGLQLVLPQLPLSSLPSPSPKVGSFINLDQVDSPTNLAFGTATIVTAGPSNSNPTVAVTTPPAPMANPNLDATNQSSGSAGATSSNNLGDNSSNSSSNPPTIAATSANANASDNGSAAAAPTPIAVADAGGGTSSGIGNTITTILTGPDVPTTASAGSSSNANNANSNSDVANDNNDPPVQIFAQRLAADWTTRWGNSTRPILAMHTQKQLVKSTTTSGGAGGGTYETVWQTPPSDKIGWHFTSGSGCVGNNNNVTLNGHNWLLGRPATFYKLDTLQSGDEVQITTARGRHCTYTVISTREYRDRFDTSWLYGSQSLPVIPAQLLPAAIEAVGGKAIADQTGYGFLTMYTCDKDFVGRVVLKAVLTKID